MSKHSAERGNRNLHVIDRFVGIAMLWMISLFKWRRRPIPATINRIGFITNAAIGDTIIFSALIRDIREHHPEIRITVFATNSNYAIAKMIQGIDEVVLLDILNPLRAIKKIREYTFDVCVDLGQWTRLTAILGTLSRSACTIGFKTKGQYRHYGFDVRVIHSFQRHELYNFKSLIFPLGINLQNLPFIDIAYISEKHVWPVRNQIVLHTKPGGSQARLKEWPEASWVQLINYLTERQYTIFLTGVPSQKRELEFIKKQCADQDSVIIFTDTLINTAVLLKSSFLVISVDTGIMHLASALQCNLIALHGPTSFHRWGALNDNARPIQSSYECTPCLNLGFERTCEKKQCGCMSAIRVDEVICQIKAFEKEAQ